MIKIYIFVTAFAFITTWGSEDCQNRPLKPVVKFFLSEKDAVKIYNDSLNEKKRLFVVKFYPYDSSVDVKELNIIPATSYEVITSSHIIVWGKEEGK